MTKIEKIESAMQANNITDNDVARAIGIDLSTWYRRKLAPNKIQIGEAEIIKKICNLSSEKASAIFFD